jgi:hypothetical protein
MHSYSTQKHRTPGTLYSLTLHLLILHSHWGPGPAHAVRVGVEDRSGQLCSGLGIHGGVGREVAGDSIPGEEARVESGVHGYG